MEYYYILWNILFIWKEAELLLLRHLWRSIYETSLRSMEYFGIWLWRFDMTSVSNIKTPSLCSLSVRSLFTKLLENRNHVCHTQYLSVSKLIPYAMQYIFCHSVFHLISNCLVNNQFLSAFFHGEFSHSRLFTVWKFKAT